MRSSTSGCTPWEKSTQNPSKRAKVESATYIRIPNCASRIAPREHAVLSLAEGYFSEIS